LAVAEGKTRQADSLYASVATALGSSQEQVFGTLRDAMDRADSDDTDIALAGARDFETSVQDLERQLGRAQELNPSLLVSPFGADVVEINEVSTRPGVFYSPGTLVLLVQHLALTFAALSLVRERQLGLSEVFRVSPLSSGEATIGKYLGFGSIALLVATVLTGTMLAFGVEVRGSVTMYVVVIALVILASLGIGFLLSAISKTDTQAVQYSMIALLLSIFFSGFVLPLDQLVAPVQTVSYLIPATYGIRALHDLIFRGAAVDPLIVGGLTAYAAVLAVGAWVVVRREVATIRG
jgi:ABC-2 type transport system permease protein